MKDFPSPPPHVWAYFQGLRDHTPGPEHFIADSSEVVLKLLRSELVVTTVLAPAEWLAAHAQLLARHPDAEVYAVTPESYRTIVGHEMHQGIMARGRRPAEASLAELAEHAPVIVLDGIAKTDNVGAIVRNAAAFGVRQILLDRRTCHPFQRRAVRTSMGNVYVMRTRQCEDLVAELRALRALGIRLVGFENRPQATDLPAYLFERRTAIVIGSEASGISPEVLAVLDDLVRIPIDQGVYALNAACASAVALAALAGALRSK